MLLDFLLLHSAASFLLRLHLFLFSSVCSFRIFEDGVEPSFTLLFVNVSLQTILGTKRMMLINQWLKWSIVINWLVKSSQWFNWSSSSKQETNVRWHAILSLFSYKTLHSIDLVLIDWDNR